MKKILAVFLVIAAAGGLFPQDAGFEWTLALTAPEKEAPVSVAAPIQMEAGDVFSLYISPRAGCYCYVVAQDSQRTAAVLHSGRLSAGEELGLGPMRLVPPSGSEFFFVIMSLTEQKELQNKIKTFQRNGSPQNGRELLNQVLALRREVSALRENPEQPVLMGGTFRGERLSPEGLKFSGAGAYVKTITINH